MANVADTIESVVDDDKICFRIHGDKFILLLQERHNSDLEKSLKELLADSGIVFVVKEFSISDPEVQTIHLLEDFFAKLF